MQTISTNYRTAMNTSDRQWDCRITLTKGSETLLITPEDLIANSLTIVETAGSSEEINIGGVSANTVGFTVLKSAVGTFPLYESECFVEYGLFVNGSFEYIPMGYFDIDEATKGEATVSIKGMDRIIRTEKPYNTNLAYPATLKQIYDDLCTKCNLESGVTSFVNQDRVVDKKPENVTYRQVLSSIMQLSGSFAKIGRDGKLYPRWYQNADFTITPDNRYEYKQRDDLVQVTGITYTGEQKFLSGSEVYPLSVDGNLLLDKNHQSVLNGILTRVNNVIFKPNSGTLPSSPHLEVGDVVVNKPLVRLPESFPPFKTYVAYADTNTGGGFSLTDSTKGFLGVRIDFENSAEFNVRWTDFSGLKWSEL